MTLNEFLDFALTQEIYLNERRIKPTQREMKQRYELFSYLKMIMQSQFPSACITLYGSTNNGFATKTSDLDISLSDVPDKHQALSSIKRLVGFDRRFKNVILISAKAPFLEFEDTVLGIKCNIVCDDGFGPKNSELLACYARMHPNVVAVGLAIKHWAGRRQINSARRATLSSYSWILLLIHYLQEIRYLPNLQRMKFKSHVMGVWEMGFNKHPHSAKKSELSAGRLLYGFFKYYSDFDFIHSVVRIHGPSGTKKSLRWFSINGKKNYIAIQDPFIRARNVACATSLRNAILIKQEIQAACEYFTAQRTYKELCEKINRFGK